jgi:O-acetyl-ADP-ribose deacetylase (regulator of RNase III)
MIRYVTGDLLASDLKIIAHGCNTHGVMGSGIALQIRERWPNVYEAYRQLHQQQGLALGTTQPVSTPDGRIVVNCMTQAAFGRDGHRYADYDAIARCIQSLNQVAVDNGESVIGLPKIGAGLGGGDWTVIEGIINDNAREFIPIVYVI